MPGPAPGMFVCGSRITPHTKAVDNPQRTNRSLTNEPKQRVALPGGQRNRQAIRARANQVATGLALMIFGFDLSALIGWPFVGTLIAGLPKSRLLGLGSMSNPHTAYDILVYLAVPTAVLIWWLLFRTTWGVGWRAVGESPVAAVAAGFSPGRPQFQALAVAGLLGGIAGAHLSLSLTWEEGMAAGCGFIAIALLRVVVTGGWSDKAKEAAAANALIDQGTDAPVKIGCGRGLFEQAALHLA